MKSLSRLLVILLVGVCLESWTSPALAADHCSALPNAAQLRQFLQNAAAGTGISASLGPGTGVGGLFGGQRMWAAAVNRDGKLCAIATSTTDPAQVWPGSQAIAKAKAYTANAFSLDSLALSTARLYTFVQPGHSLFGLNQSNPFDPRFLVSPGGSGDVGNNQITGGIITFGGGVPAYKGGLIVGAIGVSGDTACADHEIAKRVRDLAGLNAPGGPLVDDITYSSVDGASVFTHPLCNNTLRNGTSLGDELPASGY
jgi:uncharacterized protein GlcG (DUF336 family)